MYSFMLLCCILNQGDGAKALSDSQNSSADGVVGGGWGENPNIPQEQKPQKCPLFLWLPGCMPVIYIACPSSAPLHKVMSHVERRNNGVVVVPPSVGILARARGLAILTVFKAGFLVTARGGSGIVIAKLGDDLDYSEGV